MTALSPDEKKMYEELQAMQLNLGWCQSMAYNVLQNVADSNFKGIRHQLKTLGSCGDCNLNIKLAKLHSKMEAIGEEEGVLYYRSWMDDDIWNVLPFRKQVKLYHSIHQSWLMPTYLAAIGVGPVGFQAFHKH